MPRPPSLSPPLPQYTVSDSSGQDATIGPLRVHTPVCVHMHVCMCVCPCSLALPRRGSKPHCARQTQLPFLSGLAARVHPPTSLTVRWDHVTHRPWVAMMFTVSWLEKTRPRLLLAPLCFHLSAGHRAMVLRKGYRVLPGGTRQCLGTFLAVITAREGNWGPCYWCVPG